MAVTAHDKSMRTSLGRPPADPVAEDASGHGRRRHGRVAPVALLVGAIALWAASVPRLRVDRMNDVGLVSVLPVTAFVALALLTAGFCLTLRQAEPSTGLVLAHLVTFVLLIHGTPVVAYGTLRYSWAWKHLGLVDRIQRRGNLDPSHDAFSLYFQWPGFFALNAFLNELAGRNSALAVAAWAPVFFNLVSGSAVVLIARSLTADRRLVWLTAWIFLLGSWVGQDYFSPQAMNYFLFLVVIGICLRWFSPRRRPVGPDHDPATPGQRLGLLAVALLLLVTIVASHQLTPFMTLGAVTALVLWRRCTVRTLPMLMGLLIAAWLIFVAASFLRGDLRDLITSFGSSDNASSGLVTMAHASPGQTFVSLMDRVLTLLVWVLAVLGGIRLWLRRRLDPAPVLLLLTPVAMLAANNYGGEMVFRVYLFSVPFAAYLAASLLTPRAGSRPSWLSTTATFVTSVLLLTTFLFAYYGKDRMYHFTPAEVTAAGLLYDNAPSGSRLIAITSNMPWGLRNYDRFTYLWLGLEPPASRAALIDHPVELLSDLFADRHYAADYFILTRSQAAEINATGLMPAGSVERIEKALIDSGRFDVVYREADAVVFSAGRPA
ncbi:MAG: hypothetical protein M3066_11920 [Actinomycetota bacterium]|nr:hypothetical protein [Actinomycetota bacterium]